MEGFAGPCIYTATFVSNIRISHGSVFLPFGSKIRKKGEESTRRLRQFSASFFLDFAEIFNANRFTTVACTSNLEAVEFAKH